MKQPSEWVNMSRAVREKLINKINSASIIVLQKPTSAATSRDGTPTINNVCESTDSSVDDRQ